MGWCKMCGRFAATISREVLERLYRLDIAENVVPRYNIAPSQYALVLRLNPSDGKRELVSLKWGLIPGWIKQPATGPGIINARAETAGEKTMFQRALDNGRCVIPSTGFYEWDEKKRKYLFSLPGTGMLYMAGLYGRFEEEHCFVILTRDANASVSPIHHRMPVIIRQTQIRDWIFDRAAASTILSGAGPELLAMLQDSKETVRSRPGA